MNRCFYFFLSALSLFFIVSLLYFFIIVPSDFDKYQNLMRNYLNFDQNEMLTNHHKTAVQKDFFSRENQEELHHQIHCEKANMIIFEQNSHLQFSEAMRNISGWIEEKQGSEKWTRSFESEEGVFQYNCSNFTSPLLFFRSHPAQNEESTIKGKAKNVLIRFNHEGPLFQAEHITAQIHHP